ncbi:hypothetical protein ACFQV4_03515 [Streptomyces thermocarboxydus]
MTRERELLLELWHRRGAARPALEHAARLTAPPVPYGAGWAYGPMPAAWRRSRRIRRTGRTPTGAEARTPDMRNRQP